MIPFAGSPCREALAALADGYLETVRTEVKGKVVTEWVRATPKGIRLLHDTDSPQAVDQLARMEQLHAGTPPTRRKPVFQEAARVPPGGWITLDDD